MTTGTYNFMSVILDAAFLGVSTATTAGSVSGSASLITQLVITQFSDQVKVRFISQLINGISSVIKKLVKCFNRITISTFFSYCYLLIFQ